MFILDIRKYPEHGAYIPKAKPIREDVPVPVSAPVSVPVPVQKMMSLPEPDPISESESESKSDSESDSGTESDSVIETAQESGINVTVASLAVDIPTLMAQYFYLPNVRNDTLLWCCYIMIYGIEKFECVENHYTESNTFKFHLVEYIRTKKTLLKPHKIGLSATEDTLVNKPFINLETFQAIAICYNLSVCVIQDRKIFEIGRSDNDTNTFIMEKIKGKYGLYISSRVPHSIIWTTHAEKYLNFVRDSYWSMENITSPIRSISAYKLQDLIDICRKLNIPETKVILGDFGSIVNEKKKTKPELYEEICRSI